MWFIGFVILGGAASFWGLVQIINSEEMDKQTDLEGIEDETQMTGEVTIIKSVNESVTESQRDLVCYLGHGRNRYGHLIGRDKSGRVIIDMGGYTVRRQPHLIIERSAT